MPPDLLQRLWNEYSALVGNIDTITDDVDMPEDLLDELSGLVSDTEEVAKLREDLFNVGVKNIPGKVYT